MPHGVRIALAPVSARHTSTWASHLLAVEGCRSWRRRQEILAKWSRFVINKECQHRSLTAFLIATFFVRQRAGLTRNGFPMQPIDEFAALILAAEIFLVLSLPGVP